MAYFINDVIEKKSDLLYYEKVNEENIDLNEYLDISQFRLLQKKSKSKNSDNADDLEEEEDNEILFIPDENMGNLKIIPSDLFFASNPEDFNLEYLHDTFEKNNIRKI